MALDKLTLLDETIINNTATSVATTVVNNSAQTNYISFPVATASPTSNGWRVYKDSDTIAPTVGTGGSPNTTLTQNTDTPLNSTGDFRLTKTSSASRRGEGISTDFTIASRHQGKVLQISFDYELISGTLSTDDLRVYIISNPTGSYATIEPVNVSIQGSLVSSPTVKLKHIATFQTLVNATSYRLCIHVASTSTSAYTVDFNNFRVWETVQSIGSIITEPQSYIATIRDGNGNIVSKGSNILTESGSWHREGKNLILRYNLRIGDAGSAGIGGYLFLLPPGLSVDYTLAVGFGGLSGVPVVGSAFISYASGQIAGSVVLSGQTSHLPNALYIVANGATNAVGQNAYSLGNSNMSYGFEATVPIAGWGSNVAMSSDTGDGRLVSGSISGHTSTAYTTDVTKLKLNTIIKDSHGCYNTSTGDITIPISGDYVFSFIFFYSTGSQANIKIYNGTTWTNLYLGQVNSSFASSQSVKIDNLRAGDVINFRFSGDITLPTATGFQIQFHRISAGSQVIATQETVSASYYRTSTATVNALERIEFNQRLFDSHGAVTTGSVGSNNWKFTAPMSGKYSLSGQIIGNSGQIHLYKNNSVFIHSYTYVDSTGVASIDGVVDLLSGEWIDLRPNINNSVNGNTLSASAYISRIEIFRIGL